MAGCRRWRHWPRLRPARRRRSCRPRPGCPSREGRPSCWRPGCRTTRSRGSSSTRPTACTRRRCPTGHTIPADRSCGKPVRSGTFPASSSVLPSPARGAEAAMEGNQRGGDGHDRLHEGRGHVGPHAGHSGLGDVREDVCARKRQPVGGSFKEWRATYENNRLLNRQTSTPRCFGSTRTCRSWNTKEREVAAAVVPRGEHRERGRSQDAAVAAVQGQIDDLKTALGGSKAPAT